VGGRCPYVLQLVVVYTQVMHLDWSQNNSNIVITIIFMM
jgi:hypothetical protein